MDSGLESSSDLGAVIIVHQPMMGRAEQDESGEPVQACLRQQLVVAQCAPPMKDGALDRRIAERSLEG